MYVILMLGKQAYSWAINT